MITAAVLVTAAVVCVIVAFAFAFNNEAALCAYLKSSGVSAEELEDLLDDVAACSDIADIDDADAFRGGADSVFALACTLSARGDVIVGAAQSYRDAPIAANPFALLDYNSVAKKLSSLLDNSAQTAIPEIDLTTAATQLVAVCDSVVEMGQDKFNETAHTLRNILTADDIQEEVAYRSMIEALLYLIDATRSVDVAELDILDSVLYDGFLDAHVDGLASIVSIMRAVDYDSLLELSGYLPDITRFSIAVCDRAAEIDGYDSVALSILFADLLNFAYSSFDIDMNAQVKDIHNSLTILSSLDRDNVSDAQYQTAKQAADYFAQLFAPLGEKLAQDLGIAKDNAQ